MTKILSLLLALALASVAYALPGDLDTSFSGDGRVITSFSINLNARAVAIQADGKIVVAGGAFSAVQGNFVVIRYNANGALDQSFGGEGFGSVTTNFGSRTEEAAAIAIQNDGRIVVAGASGTGSATQVAIARYNADGTLDPTFSGDGRLTMSFGSGGSGATGLAIQADGRIVVVGHAFGTGGNEDFAVARFTTDGTPDTTFGGTGIVTSVGFGGNAGNDRAKAVAIQADGSIVVAGTLSLSTIIGCDESCFAVTRFSPLGVELGPAFQPASFGVGTTAEAFAMALQSDGKIVLVGTVGQCGTGAPLGARCSMALARYNADGTPDETFFSVEQPAGQVVIEFGSDSEANSVAIQPDGKIVMAGTVFPDVGFNDNFALVRLNINGTLDNTFSGDGRVITDFGGSTDATQRSDFGSAVAIQPNDGRIVVAGRTDLTFRADELSFAVARYHAFSCNGLNVTIVGTNSNDTIVGQRVTNDVIDGLGGNDIIDGLSGDDTICGGAGNDTLRGGPGDDVLIGGGGFNRLDGGAGTDTCVRSSGSINIDTGCENPIQPGPFLPGLSGEWLRVAQHCNPSSREPSCTLRGSLRVFNPGGATAVRSLVAFYLSEDDVLDDKDTFLRTERVPALDAGKERVVSLNHQLAGAGNLSGRFVIAVVDHLNNVPEANEENNVVVSPPL